MADILFAEFLADIRAEATSQRDKGDRFERAMQRFLLSDPRYASLLQHVWLWKDFPARADLGYTDTGIDIVAQTYSGEYWAVQCKCYAANAHIDKPEVDTFLATSGRTFTDATSGARVGFANRLWIATTDNWTHNAYETMANQTVPVSILNLSELENANVDWALLADGVQGIAARKAKYSLRPHQQMALQNAQAHYQHSDVGQMIMACGTGKTFTSLRIAENEAKAQGYVLVLVPSIALINQILGEWMAHAEQDMYAICVCSDPKVSKKAAESDTDGGRTQDLALPATTDPARIVHQHLSYQGLRGSTQNLIVVFSTYQSIASIAEAQQQGLPAFDMIICDEAHRTTGVELKGVEKTAFARVHDKTAIRASKRLFMTATPRIYSEDSKTKAQRVEASVASMDDVRTYGEEFYRIGFGEAVEKGLLTDYKVLVFTVRDTDVPLEFQNAVARATDGMEIPADTSAKLVGCINALSKQVWGLGAEDLALIDPGPMKRAVAFCQNIKTSRQISQLFDQVSGDYMQAIPSEQRLRLQSVASRHVDGTMNATQREQQLNWLKSDTDDSCRILSNVRCLSEGVDVPALDAIMFLSARNSQIDVVQSVGRVMRRAEGKKYGYIIIPILIPSDVEPEKALDDNSRYQVIWSVLNALRAHDDRFNAMINKIELNKKRPDKLLIGGMATSYGEHQENNLSVQETQIGFTFPSFEGLQNVIYARLVQKVGERHYWADWAKSVADIASRQIARINRLTQQGSTEAQFAEFLAEMQQSIDKNITRESAIEMLAQHTITAPVFNALFEDYAFAKNNAISTAMELMLEELTQDAHAQADREELERFYASVRKRAEGIDNMEGKQTIILELYNNFFAKAFPKMVEQLGIVYTPVQVVDFIIHSVNDVLSAEFGRQLTDKNVNILDPFTGTGTFITRLLQSGLISHADLPRKYSSEIFANEIVLLAYYIASVNIENAYHDVMQQQEFTPFPGIVLTDTFQTKPEGVDESLTMFDQNSERVGRQNATPLTVIFGNPPYSVGQRSANDNAQNRPYPDLDKRIAGTYAALSDAANKNALYDSYIRSFRYASDRLGDSDGIICFVSNGNWLDGNSTAGFRRSLEHEFARIYVFNLRGDQRTSGELSRREGGKIFGAGSRTPIAITLLVKRKGFQGRAEIFYRDIGDYLTREQKLGILQEKHSFLNGSLDLQRITPNAYGDWISTRNDAFGTFIPLASTKKYDLRTESVFVVHSRGYATAKDAWLYSYSEGELRSRVEGMIKFYNQQLSASEPIFDSTRISWSRSLIEDREKGRRIEYDPSRFGVAMYRPFQKQAFYYGERVIDQRYHNDRLFPSAESDNLVIATTSVGDSQGFSCLMANAFVDLHFVGTSQCFPLYYYEVASESAQTELGMAEEAPAYVRRDGISDAVHKQAVQQCGVSISKEDIFYYVYGLLHSPEYRAAFADDLRKALPSIPLVESAEYFWAFAQAGIELSALHVHYEDVAPLAEVQVVGDCSQTRVEKLRFLAKERKDVILINQHLRLENIPPEAYEYSISGRSAIEWVMDRYQVRVDKASGITNNPNLYGEECGQPQYILNLLQSVIALSVQTQAIVKALPKLEF